MNGPLTAALDLVARGIPVLVTSPDRGPLTFRPDEVGRLHYMLANHPERGVSALIADRPSPGVVSGREIPRPVLRLNGATAAAAAGELPLERVLGALATLGYKYKRKGHQYRARCPYHGGKTDSSLSIAERDDGKVAVHCFSGCDYLDVLGALSLTASDLYVNGGVATGGEIRHGGNGASPAAPGRITVLSARKLCELPDPPDADLLIGSLVVRRQRLLIGAHTGHGKTTLTGQLIKTAVEGGTFLDWPSAGGLRCLVIDAEQGLRSIKRQLRTWGLDKSDAVDYVRVPDGLSLDQDENEVAAVEAVLAAGRYDIVSADPLYKLHRGDSNDERSATDLMRIFDRWREDYGFASILQGHCRKPPIGAKFSMHEFFGSTAYLRGAEVVVGLQFLRPGFSRLHFFKDRDGDLKTGTSRSILFDKAAGFSADPNDGKIKETAAEVIARFLHDDPGLTLQALMASSGFAERTVRAALKKLGAAEEHGRDNAKQWSLPLDEGVSA